MTPESDDARKFHDDKHGEHDSQHLTRWLPFSKEDLSGFHDWIWALRCNFGYEFLVFLFVTQHLMKGFMVQFSLHSYHYLFRAHGLAGPRIQVLNGVCRAPFVLRPMVALVSDVFPIFGYRKSPYMAGASILGLIGFIIVGLVPPASLTTVGLVFGVCLQNMQYASCDLLSDAMYTARMRQRPERSTDLVTFIFIGMDAFGLVATFTSGFVISSYGPEAVSSFAILPAIVVLWVILRGYAQEQPVSSDDSRAMRRKYFDQESEMSVLCVLIFCAGIVIMVAALVFRSSIVNLAVSSCVSFCVIFCFGLLLSPTIAMFLVFGILSKASHLDFDGSTYYFMTDTAEQFPEGPHFEELFYVSVRGSAICICSLLGVWTYRRYLQHYSYRFVIVMTTVVISCIHFANLLFVTRTNLKFGIHDQVFVLCGEATHIIQQWHGMLQIIILARLCPSGMQSTILALAGGSHAIGAAVSRSASACLLELFDVRPDGSPSESEQFKYLWCCVLIGALAPLFFVAAFIRLVPVETDMDTVDRAGGYTATGGSFWLRWRGCASTGALVQESAP